MSQKRVFLSDSLAVLQEALIAAVHTLKAADPLSPLTLLVPSELIGSQLSTAMARAGEGHIGLRFTTLTDYAARLTEARLRREKKRRVSAALGPLLVKYLLLEQAQSGKRKRVLQQRTDAGHVSSSFQELARQPRFAQFLSETLSDLKQAGVQPHHLRLLSVHIPPRDALYREKIQHLLDLYTRYEAYLDERRLVDHTDLFTAQPPTAIHLSDGPLLVYGGLEYTAQQRRFLETLFTHRDTLVFLPWRAGSAYEAVTPTLSWLSRLGFQASPLARPQVPACALARVQTRLFERAEEPPQRPDATPPDASLHIISAPDQTQEAREIARTIFSLVREDYTFDEIGVLLTEPKTYGPLLLETFSRLGIPYTFVGERPALTTRRGKAAQALCHLLLEDCSRQRLFAFLRLARPPFPDLIGETVSEACIARWEALCLEAGIGRGGQEWRVRLATLEARDQNASEEQGEPLVPALRLLVRFMDRLLADVKTVQDQPTWEGWLASFLRMYGNYVSGEPSWTSGGSEAEADEPELNLEETLQTLSPLLTAINRPEEWIEAVLTCLSWGKVRLRKTRPTGVLLSDMAQAVGLRFRAVIIPGLAQESGARLPSQDPILSDAERQHLAEVLTLEVPARRQAVERQQVLFMLATQGAQEVLYLTYPRTVQAAARPPAPLLLQTVSALCGRQATLADLRHRSRWVAAAEGYAQSARQAVDALEFHLAWALTHAPRLKHPVSAPAVQPGLQTLPFFAPAAQALVARWEHPRLTAFDGCLQAESVRNTLRQRLFPQGRCLSASGLETYARCPFRYFLETVLDLKPWEEPEQILTLLPRDRGVLVHAILYEFFSRLQQMDQLPLSAQRSDDERRLLTRIAEEHCAAFAQTRPVGLPLLWELERERLLRRLHAFLQRERQAENGFCPAAFETFFGVGAKETGLGGREPARPPSPQFLPPHTPVPFRLDTGEEVQLRGRIDRIDVSTEHVGLGQPRPARILDYKTGRPPARGFAGGTALQLPLYLYAAQRLRPDLDWVGADYMSVDGTAQPDIKPLTAATRAETLGTLRTLITRLAEGIAAGLFFPAPAACRSCAFPAICGAHDTEWATQKLQDPSTAAWRWVRSHA